MIANNFLEANIGLDGQSYEILIREIFIYEVTC